MSRSTQTTQERDNQALEFRKNGLSLQHIAEQLGYANTSGASKAVSRARAREASLSRDEKEGFIAAEGQNPTMNHETGFTLRGRPTFAPGSIREISWADGELSGDADLVVVAQEAVVRTDWPVREETETSLVTAVNPLHDRGTALPLLRSLFVEPPTESAA